MNGKNENNNLKSLERNHPILMDMWKYRKYFYFIIPLSLIIGVIYACSLPDYYKCSIKLSPEIGGKASTENAVASFINKIGVDFTRIGQRKGREALFPTLYPDLMNSVDFCTSLFQVKVSKDNDTTQIYYFDYLAERQKLPWWSEGKNSFISLFYKGKNNNIQAHIDPFRLSPKQYNIVRAIRSKVSCHVDKKTMVISITVKDQDPKVAAIIADTVKSRLQSFIIKYRVGKAKKEYEYYEKVSAKAKKEYDSARIALAEYKDANRDVRLSNSLTKIETMEKDVQTRFEFYSLLASQKMEAASKIQESSPAFVTLQSATVPVVKAGPSRGTICFLFVAISVIGLTIWALYKEKDLRLLKDII